MKPTLDISCARVINTRFSIAMTTEPNFISEVVLAVVARLNVLFQVPTSTQVLA
jgi:hypothetical protein